MIASYMMRRYRWSLLKTLEFLNSRRPELEIRSSFISQLQGFEQVLVANGLGPKTSTWHELESKEISIDDEELLLRNTYCNSQNNPIADFSKASVHGIKQKSSLKWVDHVTGKKKSLAREGEKSRDLTKMKRPKKVVSHREVPAAGVASIIKQPPAGLD